MSVDHGERLAALEAQMKGMHRTLEKISDTLQQLVMTTTELRAIHSDIKRIEANIESLDSERDLVNSRVTMVERKQSEMDHYLKSRWYLVTAVASLAATVILFLLDRML